MKKFNKFDLVYESLLNRLVKEENAIDSKVYSHGLHIGSTFRLKPNFFTKSEAVQTMDQRQIEALKDINDRDYDRSKHYFKVKYENRPTVGPNIKSANDVNTSNIEYGIISAAEKDNNIYKFVLPIKDIKYIEILDWDGNLPPVLSPKNDYSFHDFEKSKPSPVNDKDFQGLANSPVNRSLPVQNSKL